MNRRDLVQQLSVEGEISPEEARLLVDAFFEAIEDALESNDKVEIRGFGTFKARQKNPRNGRNPKNGAPIQIKQKSFPHFKPGKELKGLFGKDGDGE